MESGDALHSASRRGRQSDVSLLGLYQESQAQNLSFTATIGRFSGTGRSLMVKKSGVKSEVDTCDELETTPTKVSVWKLLSFATVSERFWMIVGLVLATISGLGIPAWLALLARSLDTMSSLGALSSVLPNNEGLVDYLNQELFKLAVAFMVVGGITFLTGSCYVAIWTYTGSRQATRIQQAFVRSALNQDAAWFDEHDREALPTQMGTSLVYISACIGRTIADAYMLLVSALGCLVVAFWLNTMLSLIMLAFIPIVGLILAILQYFIRKEQQHANDELATAGAIATEVIAGIKTVAALCAKPHFLRLYSKHVEASEKFSIKGGQLQTVLAGIIGVCFYVTYTIAFVIGTYQVPALTAINLGRQAGVHVFGTIIRKPTIDPRSDNGIVLDDHQLQGRLEFSNIFFAYPTHKEKPILHNLSLNVEAGSSVALVGPSGSGKSTMARFLLRFYDPLQGQVKIDGHPLSKLKVSWWRSKVGYVEQEPRLFPGTIRDNIAVGRASYEVCDDDIIEAAKAACAHEFIMALSDGYDTYFAGTGTQLSGGQMQRIAIARAIIRKPVLLVLDEATSALDSTSEKHVTEALANIRKLHKMTTVTIAHRLSTIVDADTIAVLDQGRVKELGNHKSLYQQNGIYTLLCTTQGITEDTSRFVNRSKTENLHVPPSETLEKVNGGHISDIEMGAEQSIKDTNLQLKKVDEIDEVEVDMASTRMICRLLGARDGIYALLGILGSATVGALAPCEAIVMANIVNNFYTVPKDELLEVNMEWIVRFYYFAAASFLGNLFIGFGLSRSGNRLCNKLRKMAFGGMLKRNMGWFDDPEHSTGELTTILGADAEVAMGLTGWEMGYRVRVFAALIAGITVALVYSWKIGLTSIACMPLILFASMVQACAKRRKFYKKTDGLTPPTILEQGLRGIVSVQAYSLESKVSNDYDKALEPESDSQFWDCLFAGIVYGFTQGVIFLTFGIIFLVGTKLVITGEIIFLEFFTALLAVMFGAIGASQVSADFSSRQEGKAAISRILTVLEGPEDDPHGKSPRLPTISKLHGGIEFKDCHFAYPLRPDNSILYPSPSNHNKGLNLSISPQKSLGLVGRSGSGKSTVLQLVLRFYDLTNGSCHLDGSHSISEVDVEWLRKQIGYVGQQPTLFTGTVFENLLLGNPEASKEDIIAAAKAAHAHDFILNLSDGYNTDIGTGGGQLSGGQKQRIAIARAILRNPSIVVLDEATAALDNESEEKVQAALDSLQKTQPRTTLVVAHRLSTVKKCDAIAYLGNGGVIELGTHEELLRRQGEYSKLWKMQGAEEELNKTR